MIQLTLIGQLGKDAEVRDAGQSKVINFSVAVSTGYGDKKTTTWVECAKFGEKTGVSEYLKKGTKVYVSGEPSLRTWEKDGKNGAALNLRVQEIELLGSKADAAQPAQQESAQPIDVEKDLPF